MKYDFESRIDRQGLDAMAIDSLGKMRGFSPDLPEDVFDPIPMWVADMNFATAPSVTDAIMKRVSHPIFGYFPVRDEYYDAIIRWQEQRNNVKDLKKEYIGYENGVLGGVVSTLNVLCSKGDKILIHAPTYVGFEMIAKNNGYHFVYSDLKPDEDGVWRMDYEDMEQKIIRHKIHAAIICSPHNPCGRVWEREELEQAMAIFEKHDVFVISDEIWSDMMLEGNVHVPTQQVSQYAKEHTASFYAPSKTFNLAGLVGSYHIIYNRWLRGRIEKESSLTHYNEPNVLSMHALIGAYSDEGSRWVDELNEVLSKNVSYAHEHITGNYSGIKCRKAQATYILFLDCEEWCKAHDKTQNELLKAGWSVGVAWHDGNLFGYPYGIRISLGLPHTEVVEAFERLDKYVFK